MSGAYRILLADGDEPFHDMTTDILRNEHHLCDCAADAGQAMAMLAAHAYDAFILDAEMPGNSRLELVHAASETACGLPVILVTSHPTVETAVKAIHLPVEAYLVKPICREQFLTHLNHAVTRCRLYRAATDVKLRLNHWNDMLESTRKLLREPIDGNVASMVGPMLTTTFENILASAADMRRILNVLGDSDGSRRDESFEQIERANLTHAALRETVAALEESKHSFKSKRLGELRRQLQALLAVLEKRDR
jgi:CheY-like chemotaxis protein